MAGPEDGERIKGAGKFGEASEEDIGRVFSKGFGYVKLGMESWFKGSK